MGEEEVDTVWVCCVSCEDQYHHYCLKRISWGEEIVWCDCYQSGHAL